MESEIPVSKGDPGLSNWDRTQRSTLHTTTTCNTVYPNQHLQILTAHHGSRISMGDGSRRTGLVLHYNTRDETVNVGWADYNIGRITAKGYESRTPTWWGRVVERTQVSHSVAALYCSGILGQYPIYLACAGIV